MYSELGHVLRAGGRPQEALQARGRARRTVGTAAVYWGHAWRRMLEYQPYTIVSPSCARHSGVPGILACPRQV